MKTLIPEAALHQNIAVLGKNGSGKTYAAKAAIVEPLLAAGRRVGIVDPTGAWWGLRSSRDGKGAGFQVLVLGGDHGDLPLPANGGAAVARLLVEQGVSLIADTTHLSVGERTRWFTDFAGTLYRMNRTPLHLVLDEAHNFAPQGKVPDPDAGKMLHAASTLASQGRSRGIRLTMITQRPQKLHKDSLTSADTLLALRVIHNLDRGAVAEWINGCGDPAQGKEVLNTLANLQRGEGWVWYPEGGFLQRLKFPAIRTFDSSATPMDGAPIAAPKGAAAIDLTEIRAALADAVKETEANDPKLLRAEIARLKRDASKPQPAEPLTVPDPQAEERGYRRGRAEALAEAAEAIAIIRAVPAEASPLRPTPRAPAPPAPRKAAPRATSAQPVEGISRSQQRILDALAWLESVRIREAAKVQLALLSDQSPTSSGYSNNLGALRTAGLICYPSTGKVALTDSGRAAANAPARSPTTDDLHRALEGRLSSSQWRILRSLIDVYPDPLGKDVLASMADQSPTSSGYSNNLGALRSLGFIDYPAPGSVVALPVLFLK
jgi:uncharacterized protein